MTHPPDKPDQGANYGIIGDVKARAVAVGSGARAVSNQSGGSLTREDFDAALTGLNDQISRLSIPATGLEALRADLEKLKELGMREEPGSERAASLLESFIGKLKMVGVLVETVKPLSGPIKAIAAMWGIPLPF
jgi:hypothetical protein